MWLRVLYTPYRAVGSDELGVTLALLGATCTAYSSCEVCVRTPLLFVIGLFFVSIFKSDSLITSCDSPFLDSGVVRRILFVYRDAQNPSTEINRILLPSEAIGPTPPSFV